MASSTLTPPKPNFTAAKPFGLERRKETTPDVPSTTALLGNSYSATVAKGTAARDPAGNFNAQRASQNAVNVQLRSQGVAFDTLLENVPLEEYIDAVARIVSPRQLTHVSKVNRTIQMYFSHSSWAEQLIAEGIDIRDFHLDVRPLSTAPTKVIVSNVPPEVNHQWLRGELSRFGRVVGQVKTLSAATSKPEYAHIRSFRRMVLMEFPDDAALARLPKQLNITLADKPYSFYISVDVKCFKCGQMGHVRRSCPNVQTVSMTNAVPEVTRFPSQQQQQPTSNTSRSTDDAQLMESSDISDLDMQSTAPPESTEEPVVSPLSASDFPEIQQQPPQPPRIKKKPTKRRTLPPGDSTLKVFAREAEAEQVPHDDSQPMLSGSEVDYQAESDTDSQCSDQLEPGFLDTFTANAPLSVPELLSFLHEVKGSPRRPFFAKKFTTDINGLVSQLKTLFNHIKNHPIKSKFLGHARILRFFEGLKEELNACS